MRQHHDYDQITRGVWGSAVPHLNSAVLRDAYLIAPRKLRKLSYLSDDKFTGTNLYSKTYLT